MASSAPHTIVLKELYGRHDEHLADEAITPGHIIARTTTGNMIKHNDDGGPGPLLVAKEDSFLGKTIDDAYAAGDLVFYHIAAPGDELYCWLDSAENVAIGAKLESAGNGNFQALTTGIALAEVVEAVDAGFGTGSGTGTGTEGSITKRIKIRAI